MAVDSTRRQRIAVGPSGAYERHPRLLNALEQLLPVRFTDASADGLAAADAIVLFPGAKAPPEGISRHVMHVPERPGVGSGALSFTADAPAALRGLSTNDQSWQRLDAPASDALRGFTTVLEDPDSGCVWQMDVRGSLARHSPAELEPGESLRDRLRGDRLAALLPLLEFLRRTCADVDWDWPQPRAALMFDDPNLRTTTYGYLNYPDLAAWTAEAETHVSIAMIPADARLASAEAVNAFRRGGLSLLIHGNNHLRHELARPVDAETRRAWMVQALARIERFEARTGIEVARIVAPPHGRCSEAMAQTLRELGYEALCVSRPYPWLDGSPAPHSLAGMLPGELAFGDFAVLPRVSMSAPHIEMALRTYLRQPVIAYGHHEDADGGIPSLAVLAASIEGLAEHTTWLSPREIARNNYASRRHGAQLEILPFSSRIEVTVPEGCDRLVLRTPPAAKPEGGVTLSTADGRWTVPWETEIPVVGGAPVTVSLRGEVVVNAANARSGVPPRALARRLLTEMRDRAQPALARGRSRFS